jgi:hypothetical protein
VSGAASDSVVQQDASAVLRAVLDIDYFGVISSEKSAREGAEVAMGNPVRPAASAGHLPIKRLTINTSEVLQCAS